MHEARDIVGDMVTGSAAAASRLRALEVAPGDRADVSALHVAYLINQYPKVSHSFIRREILALERQGVTVDRIAIRGWDADVVDPEDIAELGRTRYVLKDGIAPLLAATARTVFSRPRQFFAALGAALGMSYTSERSLPYHMAYLAQACLILDWVRASGARHVHAHFGTNPAEVAMLLRLLGGPTYSFTAHGPEESDRGAFLGIDRKVRYAKFVAAISSHTRSQVLRRAAPEDWSKVRIVRCGLDAAFLESAGASLPSRPLLVCVARLDAEKGHMVLLEALQQVCERHPDCRLVLVGDGPMRPAIEARIRQLDLGDHVKIAGWLTSAQVREEILAARALVLPSFQEGLPVVIMEAMALRRPVIATYVAGVPELVRDGIEGWLVPAGSVHMLVEAIDACLATSLDDLRRIGEAARERVAANHAIDREALKLGQLFRDEPRPERQHS